jgi:D-alanyl-D-alanine carboxypeptidase
VLVGVVCTLLVAVFLMAFTHCTAKRDVAVWASVGVVAVNSTGLLWSEATAEKLGCGIIGGLYYYEEPRLQRYQDFQRSHPEYPADKAVWMVDCDLDRSPYAEGVMVSDPANLHVLVNKQRRLPAEYEPGDLVVDGNVTVRAIVVAPLGELIASAAADGVGIVATSGFRSYVAQETIWNNVAGISGEAIADESIARAGFSEHQTGLAVDINSADYHVYQSPEDFWLAEHAWEYGFIVRYTNENSEITQYVAEPWHLRYVGKDVARLMHDKQIGSLEEYCAKYVLHALP